MEAPTKTVWYQKEITLPDKGKGCHYITDQILSAVGKELGSIQIGQCHIFRKHRAIQQIVKHTSASITLNEVYDPSVLGDMAKVLDRLVPEDKKLYKHTSEGKDDMPAHAKTSLTGVSHTIPITEGKLNMGTWQGIWLCEHRSASSSRQLVITLTGMSY